ncbi:MAG: DUF2851 family protein [Ignavibacteriaceae bacterium]
MFKKNRFGEKLFYEIWREKNFSKKILNTNNLEIEILDAGENNKDLAGPDFLNSRIKIGNITYKGDVEIDTWHSNWKSHGHYLHKKYNKVILHVVLSNERFKPYVITQDGRKVHSVCLFDFLNDVSKSAIRDAIISERNSRRFSMPCAEYNNDVLQKDKLKFILELGVERFNRKEKRILERLKEMIYLKQMNIREPIVRYDFGEEFRNKKFSTDEFNDTYIWQQLIYEMIFEALGYSKNKEMMGKLAAAVNLEFLNQFDRDDDFKMVIESSLFNVSGILLKNYSSLDEKTAGYLRTITEIWSSIKDKYDGTYFNNEKWHFFKLRPQNFPTVRIAGGSRILNRLIRDNLFEKILLGFSENDNPKKVILISRNLLIVEGEGFWRSHFVIGKDAKVELKYFVGLSRADEIIVNVILPIFAVYFEIFKNNDVARRVKNLYLNFHQKSSNQVVNQVMDTLRLNDHNVKSVNIQGMIELFRNYCVKERCLECKIGKEVFQVETE